ncbi:hypothetical protein COV19_03775 [Candidatus Woesearchaeota archaeon CG10_big_fil_rev_8_21_14_0_10_44_13]|nr:MAG: hypothetical protein COV19_03775 [Candidatus Woesearchaeota archaeon CG10_big_fil_rev_8_21_14_0_10_44_13]
MNTFSSDIMLDTVISTLEGIIGQLGEGKEYVLDYFEEKKVRSKERDARMDMQSIGTMTEPTAFSYPKIIHFYNDAQNMVEGYKAYAQKHPSRKKTLAARQEKVFFHINLIEFHAAWYVLHQENNSLTEDEFKKLSPQERHGRFTEVLERKPTQYHGLISQRDKVMDLCAKEGILSQSYK